MRSFLFIIAGVFIIRFQFNDLIKNVQVEICRKAGISNLRVTQDTSKRASQKSAILRGDTARPRIALVFTADEFADGGDFITAALKKENVKASFFLTGNFYRNRLFRTLIRHWIRDGHYLGSHSDKHLLYCDWQKRDSLFVTRKEFESDIMASYAEMKRYGIRRGQAHYFLPPYEWYNDSIVDWTSRQGLQLVCFTPGTRSTADYTYPEMGSRYADSKSILASIFEYEQRRGMNGFILLVHAGTDPRRKDKLYYYLPLIIKELKTKGYEWVKIDELLEK